jgi:carbon-monoxide dehydrogenase medium subunit
VRSPGAEAAIIGRPLTEETLAALASAAGADAAPISDLRASARYRRHTVGVMARRAVEVAASRASGTPVAVPANHALGIGVPLEGVA